MKKRILSMLLTVATLLTAISAMPPQRDIPAIPAMVSAETAEYHKGNVNGQGGVDIFDALEVLKHLVGMNSAIRDSQEALYAALITDASKESGVPTIFDVLEILKYIVGMDSAVFCKDCEVYRDCPCDVPDEAIFSITDIALESSTSVSIQVTASDECYLVVEILDDVTGTNTEWASGSRITGGTTEIDEAVELEFVSVTIPQLLPDYFVVTAELTSADGDTIYSSYTFVEYTRAYEEFLALTVDDFDEDLVINLDDSDDNNFMVLKEEIPQFVTGENGNNILDDSRADEGVYVFTNAAAGISLLGSGDLFAVISEDGNTFYLIEVLTISDSNGQLTITSNPEPQLSDFADYIKIDIELELEDGFYDDTGADEGVVWLNDPDDPEYDVVVPGEHSEAHGDTVSERIDGSMKSSVSLGVKFTKGAFSAGGKVTGSVTFAVKISHDIWRLFFEAKVTAKAELEAKLEFKFTAERTSDVPTKIDLGGIAFPSPIPGVYLKAGLTIPIKVTASAGIVVNKKVTSEVGFKLGTNGYQPINSRTVTASLFAEGEISVTFGPRLALSVNVVGDFVKAELYVEGGVEIKATATTANGTHLCTLCVKIAPSVYLKAGFECSAGIWQLRWKYDHVFGELRLTLGQYFVSVINAPDSIYGGNLRFGRGECQNKSGQDPAVTTARPSVTTPPGGEPPVVVGETVRFGGRDWRVLDIYGNRVLVISDKLLDESRPYHEAWEDVTWADSSLRAYLNGEYYNSFSSADRARIVQVINKNDDNQWFYTPGGVDTQDRIFLLSLEEVVKHFGDSGQLANGNPNNSYWIDDEFNDNRATHSWDNYPAWWWLRSPGVNRSSAACVGDDGNVFVRGLGVIGDDVDYRSDGVGGVRPALWLRLGN